MIQLQPPFLLFLGNAPRLTDLKTAAGVLQWRRDDCLAECVSHDDTPTLGLPRMTPETAAAQGARSLLVGVAPLGGRLDPSWLPTLTAALDANLVIVSGLHNRLTSYPTLVAAARGRPDALLDLRVPPTDLSVGTGRPRNGKRVLTIGSDCAVGKKYTALAMTQGLQARGVSASFHATGQTGLMIAERGVPLDAVPADFISGAVEHLTPEADAEHWQIIEGQGALHHPAYAGVSLGLLHGAQADALVLCHDPHRTHLEDLESFAIPPLREIIADAEHAARRTNCNARCIGVALNTVALSAFAAGEACAAFEAELQLPVTDPMRHGPERLLNALLV
ncbi:MAG: DUF1611 domain-containing protein [Pseudomonadota bacterium]